VPRGPAFAAPLGSGFALGWTPCIGPVLAGLLATAAGSRTAAVGAALLAVYAAGLGVPFLLVAWAVARGRAGIGLLRRHHRMFAWTGGALLVAIGLAMALGFWTRLFAPLVRLFVQSGWPPI
jgi:cytochrome c-type biogenesis protein